MYNAFELPPGKYILNNGEKRKGVAGRFTLGRTQPDVKKALKALTHVVFTTSPAKAEYVILPDTVRKPGEKLLARNAQLSSDRRRWFSESQAHAAAITMLDRQTRV
jgi:hypothetical protein